ncbi:aspartic protease pm5 [Stylonychia lemnae]|uniref:Aspartic protease pm5 n=1 Tax=Stylonychia lemnae TaxID=5949 RepID=A0A078AJ03_STYLE|nr:aspartic protease pm5 [Stylonychia lemnae]|eukprot:CDW82204.1 aspartic protease pm5 [Stylonychia lemnae]
MSISAFLQEKEFIVNGQVRRLFHTHLQSTPLFGNSTDLEYFYVDIYAGINKEPQALIVDTGSGITAFPCENHCKPKSCGNHINKYFKVDDSQTKYVYQCTKDCETCFDGDKCDFSQSYGEGSTYNGFLVRDNIYFGDNYHSNEDSFPFTFSCVYEETNLFFTQQADGILGMMKDVGHPLMKPIFQAMHEKHLIEKQLFTLCLGKNGGYFQIGGYDKQSHISEIQWIPLLNKGGYEVQANGISINNHFIAGSDEYKTAFIDSGTTFTYFPPTLYEAVVYHMKWFCDVDPENNCKGEFYNKALAGSKASCFKYDENQFPEGPLKYFESFPVINLLVEGAQISWYPSEYLYREQGNLYCMAVQSSKRNQLLLGGTFMRQQNFIFDIENNRVGVARAQCNNDLNQVKSEEELIQSGQKFGLVKDYLSSNNTECDGSHQSASLTKKLESKKGVQYTSKSSKKDEFDIPHLILYILDFLILVVAIALVYTFGKDIYKRYKDKKEGISSGGKSSEFQVIDFNDNNKKYRVENSNNEIELQSQGTISHDRNRDSKPKYQMFDNINDLSVDTEDK